MPTDKEPDSGRTGEFGALARWLDALPAPGPETGLGPGDDVAWLRANPGLVLSVDSLVEDVHFRRSWCSAEELGWRAMGAALSDLAASRARPVGCLLALALPALDPWADKLVAGLLAAANHWHCPVLGGDTAGSTGGAMISVTVVGSPVGDAPLLRSGARPGDLLLLSGPVGHQARILRRLLAGETVDWPRPIPRLDLVDSLADATAGIDLSDGLLADAEHLARASGVRLAIDRKPGWDRTALTGGEDYELLITAPTRLQGFDVIGCVETGQGVCFSDGSPLPARPWGWVHGGQG